MFHSPLGRVATPFRHVYTEPDNETCGGTERKQKRETVPVVSRFVDDRLDHVRADHRRRAIRQTE